MPSSPGQHNETSWEACSLFPQPIDPPDELGLLDFDSSDIGSQEASVKVLIAGPANQDFLSGGEDTFDSLESSNCQGMR